MDYEKYGLQAYGALPNKKQMEWFRRERSIFFHFGMNTFTDKEWGDGTELPSMFNKISSTISLTLSILSIIIALHI